MEQPVFFDQSGRRWRALKIVLTSFLVGFLTFAGWLVPKIGEPVALPPLAAQATTGQEALRPADLIAAVDHKTIPVLGNGPFLRLAAVEEREGVLFAVDPYTKQVFRVLSPEDLETIAGHHYVLERYQVNGTGRIALTFDDGPDPVFTGQILDILSREKVRATFFVTGGIVARYPDLVKRAAREGHLIGNHTFSHLDFSRAGPLRSGEEINATERIVQAVTNQYPAYFRPPYIGEDDDAVRDVVDAIAYAQSLGYTIAGLTMDTHDWEFTPEVPEATPAFDGTDQVVLLHDAGGNRSETVSYLPRLIAAARTAGYEFVTLEQLSPEPRALTGAMTSEFVNQATHYVARVFLTAPKTILFWLFLISSVATIVSTVVYLLFASLGHRRRGGKKKANTLVSVILPAYNEANVIGKTIRSIIATDYSNLELIIVDDGSTDGTSKEVLKIVSPLPLRLIRLHRNCGKSAALNAGAAAARGEVLVTLDADTLFNRTTISRLVAAMGDPKVGAVAGVVKVGNKGNLLTRWQALEYLTSIHVFRAAQAYLGAITIVPGACAAWRRSALTAVGGFSQATLAEDCDLTLSLHREGYRITQAHDAVAYTEAPTSIQALARQRFRWIFGHLQSLWKHRDMVMRPRFGFLGLVMLPYTAFSLLVPLLFYPFILTTIVRTIMVGQIATVGLYFALFSLAQLAIVLVGTNLAKERYTHVAVFPLYRLAYEPLWIYLLYRSMLTALKGSRVGWNKLSRTGSVRPPHSLFKPIPIRV